MWPWHCLKLRQLRKSGLSAGRETRNKEDGGIRLLLPELPTWQRVCPGWRENKVFTSTLGLTQTHDGVIVVKKKKILTMYNCGSWGNITKIHCQSLHIKCAAWHTAHLLSFNIIKCYGLKPRQKQTAVAYRQYDLCWFLIPTPTRRDAAAITRQLRMKGALCSWEKRAVGKVAVQCSLLHTVTQAPRLSSPFSVAKRPGVRGAGSYRVKASHGSRDS